MHKKISVIIPCFNQSEFLEETCNSTINQTHTNWETLIINDGATDNTEIVALKICEKDSRFKYFYKNNGGLSSARNYGLNRAEGDYIQFLDADDIIAPEKFEKSLATPYFDIVISDFILFKDKIENTSDAYCDLSNVEYNYLSLLTKWDVEYTIPIHCGLFSSKIIGNICFNESLKAKEDWLFWLEIFKKEPNIKFINEKLAYYRLHQNSMTQQKSLMHSNTKLAMNHIYNSISDEHKSSFVNRIINEIIDEKSKSDYLFKLKNERDVVINNTMKNLERTEITLCNTRKSLEKIKSSFTYKTIYKIEREIRRLL
jgi:glycosyltransferase involved in cell wall biosynthesis